MAYIRSFFKNLSGSKEYQAFCRFNESKKIFDRKMALSLYDRLLERVSDFAENYIRKELDKVDLSKERSKIARLLDLDTKKENAIDALEKAAEHYVPYLFSVKRDKIS